MKAGARLLSRLARSSTQITRADVVQRMLAGSARCLPRLLSAAMRLLAPTLAVVVGALTGCGGAGSPAHPRSERQAPGRSGPLVASIQFVRSPPVVLRECQSTAEAAQYAVPCPMMLPEGIAPTPGVRDCRFAFITAERKPDCGAAEWRGWIFGSTQLSGSNAGPAGFQHLGLQGAPRAVRDPARAIDGPAMVPGSRVQGRGKLLVGKRTMHWYYVTPGTNVGSAFMGHLVLVWTFAGHTYAYGFHVIDTLAEARELDLELVNHLLYVYPRPYHSNT
jgi:hypothetical protein